MFFLPLNHNLAGADCLVVGGGQTALRKIEWLVKAEAKVRVLSLEISDEIRALGDSVSTEVGSFTHEQIHIDTRLVIAATNDKLVNESIYEAATKKNVLVNCVDDPAHCTVTFPAIIDREPVVVSVSTSASAPALARIIRGWVEEALPAGLGAFANWVGDHRQRIADRLPNFDERVRFWDEFVNKQSVADLTAGRVDALDSRLENELSKQGSQGRVTLVGAGPGDPELITLKALRALQAADVVLYDKLANPELLSYARRDAKMIDVGKRGPKPNELPTRPNNRGAQQSSINEIMLAHANAGRWVVRLKGGDPFIFGRGGEEIEVLVEAGIEYEVIPGITASLGAASYAGIPLTHRDVSQSVRFVTGHRVENTVNVDWPEFARPFQTLVIYMGLVGLPTICARLIEHGAPANRPVAVIENATRTNQRVLDGTLETIADQVENAEISGPSILIIGEVVGLRRY
ncbi:MAG: uroporphyrinogen-III C-methyltransferase [Pseudomonadales bacterium]|nr:uroporphyrinogen-III C-methyltransferase [Pseudomonadales bacterium]